MEQFSFEKKDFLGNRLRKLRLAFGFKQSDVAKTLNVSRSTYSYYETGKTRPDPSVLGKLSRYYNVSVETFYEDFPMEEISLRDAAGHRHRTSRSSAADPHRVGELLPVERSLVLFLRSNGYVTAKQVLNELEDRVDLLNRETQKNRENSQED